MRIGFKIIKSADSRRYNEGVDIAKLYKRFGIIAYKIKAQKLRAVVVMFALGSVGNINLIVAPFKKTLNGSSTYSPAPPTTKATFFFKIITPEIVKILCNLSAWHF